MRSQSSFRRRDDGPGSAIFEVTPAQPSMISMAVSVAGFLALSLIAGLILAAIMDSFLGIFLGLALAGVFYWLIEWRHFLTSQRYRKPVTIKVNSQGLTKDGQLYAMKDIAELEIRASGKAPDNAQVVATGGSAVSSAVSNVGIKAGNAARRRQAERSFLLTIRTKQSSQTQVIAGGLTLDCAQSLMNDLTAALGTARG